MAQTVTCPDCGASVSADAPTCPDCGAAMPKKSAGGSLARLLRSIAAAVEQDRLPAAPAAAATQLARVTKHVPIAKVDTERHLVYGVVYEPNVDDAHGDAMTPAEIEKACHRFMENYSRDQAESGLEHQTDVTRQQVTVAESYIAPVAFTLGKQKVTAGSWVLATKVHDPAIWKAVKSGEYTGYSFEGWGRRVPATT